MGRTSGKAPPDKLAAALRLAAQQRGEAAFFLGRYAKIQPSASADVEALASLSYLLTYVLEAQPSAVLNAVQLESLAHDLFLNELHYLPARAITEAFSFSVQLRTALGHFRVLAREPNRFRARCAGVPERSIAAVEALIGLYKAELVPRVPHSWECGSSHKKGSVVNAGLENPSEASKAPTPMPQPAHPIDVAEQPAPCLAQPASSAAELLPVTVATELPVASEAQQLPATADAEQSKRPVSYSQTSVESPQPRRTLRRSITVHSESPDFSKFSPAAPDEPRSTELTLKEKMELHAMDAQRPQKQMPMALAGLLMDMQLVPRAAGFRDEGQAAAVQRQKKKGTESQKTSAGKKKKSNKKENTNANAMPQQPARSWTFLRNQQPR